MALSSLSPAALAEAVLDAERQLDAAIVAGDKVEAARLFPILRSLVRVSVAA